MIGDEFGMLLDGVTMVLMIIEIVIIDIRASAGMSRATMEHPLDSTECQPRPLPPKNEALDMSSVG